MPVSPIAHLRTAQNPNFLDWRTLFFLCWITWEISAPAPASAQTTHLESTLQRTLEQGLEKLKTWNFQNQWEGLSSLESFLVHHEAALLLNGTQCAWGIDSTLKDRLPSYWDSVKQTLFNSSHFFLLNFTSYDATLQLEWNHQMSQIQDRLAAIRALRGWLRRNQKPLQYLNSDGFDDPKMAYANWEVHLFLKTPAYQNLLDPSTWSRPPSMDSLQISVRTDFTRVSLATFGVSQLNLFTVFMLARAPGMMVALKESLMSHPQTARILIRAGLPQWEAYIESLPGPLGRLLPAVLPHLFDGDEAYLIWQATQAIRKYLNQNSISSELHAY